MAAIQFELRIHKLLSGIIIIILHLNLKYGWVGGMKFIPSITCLIN